MLLLPAGGVGPSITVGALEKAVTAALQELSTPAALTSWCKGALLTKRVADEEEEGSEGGADWDAVEEVAHPSADDGPMQRLLSRKKVSDAAVRQLVTGCGAALGAGVAAAAAGVSAVSTGGDSDGEADAAGAAAAVDGLAADAELFMVDTEGQE